MSAALYQRGGRARRVVKRTRSSLEYNIGNDNAMADRKRARRGAVMFIQRAYTFCADVLSADSERARCALPVDGGARKVVKRTRSSPEYIIGNDNAMTG